MSKRNQQDRSKSKVADVALTPVSLSLPSSNLESRERRESYLKILHAIVTYVDPLRRTLEAAYDDGFRAVWRPQCLQIRNQLARQIHTELGAGEASRKVQSVEGGKSDWSVLEKYGDAHPLIDLYMNVCGVIESLDARSRAARELPEEDIVKLSAKWSGFGKSGHQGARRTQFGIEVEYELSKMRNRPKGIDGLFYERPGMIVVFSDGDQQASEMTRRHERVHALLAGAFDFSSVLEPAERISAFNTLISQMNRKDGSLRGFNKFKRDFNPTVVVDETHEEVLAQLHNSLDSLASGGESCYCAELSTAGHFIDSVSNHLVAQSEKVYDQTYQREIVRTGTDIQALFQKQVTALRQAHFIATLLSPESVREIEALAIALLPSQWHHIYSYLEYRFGRDSICLKRDAFRILEGQIRAGERERHILRQLPSQSLSATYRAKLRQILFS
jgi:hypothetical protein